MMPRNMIVAGTDVAAWPGVEVVQRERTGQFAAVHGWPWSANAHPYYEVAQMPEGSYWVPASTNQQDFVKPLPIVGEPDLVRNSVNPGGNEFRPEGIYIWIPYIAADVGLVTTDNRVKCVPPGVPPVALLGTAVGAGDGAIGALADAHATLDMILGDDDKSAFKDSDGLISFVNLSSDFVSNNPEYKTGQTLCDMIANYYSTLRSDMFGTLTSGKIAPLKGDPVPTTQWDASVTHYMQYLLQKSGGLTDYAITTEAYSDTQYVAEFSTSFLKTIFDAIAVPASVVSGVTAFISGVGESLRVSWDDRSRNYAVGLLGQCHEAVQQNTEGTPIYRYFPKTKYYYLSVSSSQQEFTTSCSSARKITFNFQYESYVTAIAAAALDSSTKVYTKFYGFLERVQKINYKNATNLLDSILEGTASASPAEVDVFNVNLAHYPVLHTPANLSTLSGASGRRLTLA
jgi:hypothetical protein